MLALARAVRLGGWRRRVQHVQIGERGRGQSVRDQVCVRTVQPCQHGRVRATDSVFFRCTPDELLRRFQRGVARLLGRALREEFGRLAGPLEVRWIWIIVEARQRRSDDGCAAFVRSERSQSTVQRPDRPARGRVTVRDERRWCRWKSVEFLRTVETRSKRHHGGSNAFVRSARSQSTVQRPDRPARGRVTRGTIETRVRCNSVGFLRMVETRPRMSNSGSNA